MDGFKPVQRMLKIILDVLHCMLKCRPAMVFLWEHGHVDPKLCAPLQNFVVIPQGCSLE